MVDWLKSVTIPPELWTMAFHKKVLSKFAYNKVFTSYDAEAALEASNSILDARHTLSHMRTGNNTISIRGLRFFDARDVIVDYFTTMGVDDAEEGEMVFYIQHGTSLKDPPSTKTKIREWILEAYKQAKRVEPCEKDDSFTVVEFDFASPCWKKKESVSDSGFSGTEVEPKSENENVKVQIDTDAASS